MEVLVYGLVVLVCLQRSFFVCLWKKYIATTYISNAVDGLCINYAKRDEVRTLCNTHLMDHRQTIEHQFAVLHGSLISFSCAVSETVLDNRTWRLSGVCF